MDNFRLGLGGAFIPIVENIAEAMTRFAEAINRLCQSQPTPVFPDLSKLWIAKCVLCDRIFPPGIWGAGIHFQFTPVYLNYFQGLCMDCVMKLFPADGCDEQTAQEYRVLCRALRGLGYLDGGDEWLYYRLEQICLESVLDGEIDGLICLVTPNS